MAVVTFWILTHHICILGHTVGGVVLNWIRCRQWFKIQDGTQLFILAKTFVYIFNKSNQGCSSITGEINTFSLGWQKTYHQPCVTELQQVKLVSDITAIGKKLYNIKDDQLHPYSYICFPKYELNLIAKITLNYCTEAE